MKKIIMTKTSYAKKAGTKTVWEEISKEVKEVTEDQHEYATSKDTQRFFRRLGGSESATYGNTSFGYKCTKLVSTSPDKQSRTIREYKFIWNLD